MAEATSLSNLLRIRHANAAVIDRINGHLGSALGFKTKKGEMTAQAAVIVFVPRKVAPELLPPGQQIPKRLEGPGGLWCATDVVVGHKAEEEPPPPPLPAAKQRIVEELQSGSIGIVGGIQLGGWESDGRGYVGTAACAVRRRTDGRLGLLTNQHVGGPSGRPIYHPDPGRYRIGHTRVSFEYDADEYYFDGLIDEEDAYYRVDCAYVELSEHAAALAKPGLHALGPVGPPLKLNLRTMGPIGRRVVSIGRTRGITRGTIMAFAYEWYDEEESVYTDYLVLGDGEVFSDHGDSGKLIVTDDDRRNAIALLWGGWFEKLRRGVGQENWTYAIDINKVLDKLEVRIATSTAPVRKGPGAAARFRAKKVSRRKR